MADKGKRIAISGVEGELDLDERIRSNLKKFLEAQRSECPSYKFPDVILEADDGVMIGRLEFYENGNKIDCSLGFSGTLIPRALNQLTNFTSDAVFILVVENWSCYLDLLQSRFFDRFPCLLVTSKGNPLPTAALFLRKLKMELNLPVLLLTSFDLTGMRLLLQYRYGSCLNRLPYLEIGWLGLMENDISRHGIPPRFWSPFTDEDSMISVDLQYEYEDVKNEKLYHPNTVSVNQMIETKRFKMYLDSMIHGCRKVEIEALWSIDSGYLINVFLPLKLQECDWI